MTRIPAGGAATPVHDAQPASDGHHDRTGRMRDDGRGMQQGLGDSAFRDTGADAREVAFMVQMAKAARDQEEHGDSDADGEAANAARLLASSDIRPSVTIAESPLLPVGERIPLSRDMLEKITTLTDRVEKAVNAQMLIRSGGLHVNLKLPNGPDGLGAVAITMNAQRIEVVLSRSEAAIEYDGLAAAQTLVQQLQQRFPRLRIAVLEIGKRAEMAAAASGAEEIAQLFSSGKDRK